MCKWLVSNYRTEVLLSLVALFIYSLFLILFLSNNACLLMYDSGHYHEVAQGLLQHGGFVNYAGQPFSHRLPGYPLFLACGYFLTGLSVYKTLLIQLVFAATLPVLIYQFVMRLTGQKRLAVLTGWLSVCAPAFMIFAGLVMSEILSTWLFLLFLLFFLQALDESTGYWPMVGAGIALGLMSLVRPVGHLLLPFLLLFMVVFLKRSLLQRLLCCALFSTSWLMIVGWWLVRNALLTGYVFFHTLPGPHFINHVGVRLVAAGEQIPYAQAQQQVYALLPERKIAMEAMLGRNLHEIEFVKLQEALAVQLIKRYPWQFCKLVVINCFKTAFALYSSELLVIDANGVLPSYDRSDSWSSIKRFLSPTLRNHWIIGVIYLEILLMLLSCAGAVMAVRSFWRIAFQPRAVLTVGLIGFFVGISLACGYARLRMAIEPFYLLAAAYALNTLWCWCKRNV